MEATAPATLSSHDAIAQLAAHYTLRDPDAIADFVRAHPEVVGPLLEAVEVLPRYFGPGAPLVLSVERDREARDHTELVVAIGTELEADAALACLARFDERWWRDAPPPVARVLLFTLEFRER